MLLSERVALVLESCKLPVHPAEHLLEVAGDRCHRYGSRATREERARREGREGAGGEEGGNGEAVCGCVPCVYRWVWRGEAAADPTDSAVREGKGREAREGGRTL